MKTCSVFFLPFICSTVFDMCTCRPTDKPLADPDAYDTLNITCVSERIKSNSTEDKASELTRLDNIGMENTSAINETDVYAVINATNTTRESAVRPTELHQGSERFTPAKRELPMGMIIAGPAAALGIVVFLCFSYYCHTTQLNRQAKRLSMALYVTPDESTESTNEFGPGPGPAVIPRIPKQSTSSLGAPLPPRISRENSDLYAARRKSTLAVPSLSVPGNLHHKRGSSWSALADQEILNLSAPRRHSTFIL